MYLCSRKGLKHEKMKNRMFNFTPPDVKMLHLRRYGTITNPN